MSLKRFSFRVISPFYISFQICICRIVHVMALDSHHPRDLMTPVFSPLALVLVCIPHIALTFMLHFYLEFLLDCSCYCFKDSLYTAMVGLEITETGLPLNLPVLKLVAVTTLWPRKLLWASLIVFCCFPSCSCFISVLYLFSVYYVLVTGGTPFYLCQPF